MILLPFVECILQKYKTYTIVNYCGNIELQLLLTNEAILDRATSHSHNFRLNMLLIYLHCLAYDQESNT